MDGTWEEHGKLLLYTRGNVASKKIAAYDLDGTIITTRSGKTFQTNYDDWKLLYPEVAEKIQRLSQDGFKIVIFSNQSGLEKGKIEPRGFKRKIEKIVEALKVPIQGFFAIGFSLYRKPAPGMWDHLVEKPPPVDISSSFYVGDAAGRRPAGCRKKDFSCCDRLFAINLNLTFYTPEEHFLGETATAFDMPSFDPRIEVKNDELVLDPVAQLIVDEPEMIILVGPPASGKTSFAQRFFASYTRINRDTLKTWQKCVKAARAAIVCGESVIIDNTNPDPVSRGRYLEIARDLGIPSRCFVMMTSMAQAFHNEQFRGLTVSTHKPIGKIVYNTYAAKYQEPKLDEGFKEIVKARFNPIKTERLYKLFLVDA